MPEMRSMSSAAIRAGSVRLTRAADVGSPVSGAKSGLTSEKSDTGNRLSSKSATNIEMTMESKSTRGRGVGSGAEHLALVELSASPG